MRLSPPGRCCTASGDASQKSSIFTESALVALAARPPTSRPARRPRCGATAACCGATRTTDPAPTCADVVAEAHRQRPARDEVELLLLLVVVAGALLEVAVRRHADQRHRDLLGAERVAQGPELAGDVRAGVDVVDVVRVDDRVVAHLASLTAQAEAKPVPKPPGDAAVPWPPSPSRSQPASPGAPPTSSPGSRAGTSRCSRCSSSRRARACVLVLAAAIVWGGALPDARFALWAAAAGAAELLGFAALYRGLAVGAMSVVAPLSATAALVPLVVGLAAGEHIGRAPGRGARARARRHRARVLRAVRDRTWRTTAGVGLALLAALGFGAFFVGMDRASDGGVLWAVALEPLRVARAPRAVRRRDAAARGRASRGRARRSSASASSTSARTCCSPPRSRSA